MTTNGKPAPPTPKQFLSQPKTADYLPSAQGLTGNWAGWDHRPWFSLYDVMRMRRDPQIQFGLRIIRAPLHTVTWKVQAQDSSVAKYVDRTLRHFWQQDLLKVLMMLEWGRAGGEVLWKLDDDTGLIEYDCLKDIHPIDLKPLKLDGEWVGNHVYRVQATKGPVKLFPPRAAYFLNEPEFGALFGLSRLRGAWEPWQEKRGRHGAIDVRRLWYIKNAFRGGKMYHPLGVTETEPGVVKSNQDLAREIGEKVETGGIMVLPNVLHPETKERIWDYEEPQINGELRDVRDYPKDLDVEILLGLGIPPEVVQAAETGSGWSGRSVPFLVWLTGEDEIADNVIRTFARQVLRPGVDVNFGPGTPFEILPTSLVPKPEQQQGQQPMGGAPDAAGSSSPITLQPYQGPRGGQGMRNPNTGAISYGLSHEPVQLADVNPWQPYQGSHGGRGWVNSQTGEVVYQEEQPGVRGPAQQQQPQSQPGQQGQPDAQRIHKSLLRALYAEGIEIDDPFTFEWEKQDALTRKDATLALNKVREKLAQSGWQSPELDQLAQRLTPQQPQAAPKPAAPKPAAVSPAPAKPAPAPTPAPTPQPALTAPPAPPAPKPAPASAALPSAPPSGASHPLVSPENLKHTYDAFEIYSTFTTPLAQGETRTEIDNTYLYKGLQRIHPELTTDDFKSLIQHLANEEVITAEPVNFSRGVADDPLYRELALKDYHGDPNRALLRVRDWDKLKEAIARWRPGQRLSGEFREEDHPRGQPENAGQFASSGAKKPIDFQLPQSLIERARLFVSKNKHLLSKRPEELASDLEHYLKIDSATAMQLIQVGLAAPVMTGVKKGKLVKLPIANLDFPGGLLPDVAPLNDNQDKPIIVKKLRSGKYRVVDGVGRASGMKNAGSSSIHAILVSDEDLALNPGAGDDPDWVQSMHQKYAPYSVLARRLSLNREPEADVRMAWDESAHPRGQPDNAGQFTAKASASAGSPPAKPRERPAYIGDPIKMVFTDEMVPESVKQSSTAAVAQMTEQEGDALGHYTGSGYKTLNAAMRKCPPDFQCLGESQKEMVAKIESAIAKAPPFPEPVSVFRGLGNMSPETMGALLGQMERLADSDQEFLLPSITSTSLSPVVLNFFAGRGGDGFVFHIQAKRGLYVAPLAEHGEQEIIQSSQTRYRVVAVEKDIPLLFAGGKSAGRCPVVYLEEV